MSSRALRRLQRERDTELSSVCQSNEVEASNSDVTLDTGTADLVHDSDGIGINQKASSGPANLFDLVITMCLRFEGAMLCVIHKSVFKLHFKSNLELGA